MGKPCYGSYSDKEECASCVLLYPCTDLTIAVDHCDEIWAAYQDYRSYIEDHCDLDTLRMIDQQRGGWLGYLN